MLIEAGLNVGRYIVEQALGRLAWKDFLVYRASAQYVHRRFPRAPTVRFIVLEVELQSRLYPGRFPFEIGGVDGQGLIVDCIRGGVMSPDDYVRVWASYEEPPVVERWFRAELDSWKLESRERERIMRRADAKGPDPQGTHSQRFPELFDGRVRFIH